MHIVASDRDSLDIVTLPEKRFYARRKSIIERNIYLHLLHALKWDISRFERAAHRDQERLSRIAPLAQAYVQVPPIVFRATGYVHPRPGSQTESQKVRIWPVALMAIGVHRAALNS